MSVTVREMVLQARLYPLRTQAQTPISQNETVFGNVIFRPRENGWVIEKREAGDGGPTARRAGDRRIRVGA